MGNLCMSKEDFCPCKRRGKGLRRAPQSRGGGESRDEARREGKMLSKREPLSENQPQNGRHKTGALYQTVFPELSMVSCGVQRRTTWEAKGEWSPEANSKGPSQ